MLNTTLNHIPPGTFDESVWATEDTSPHLPDRGLSLPEHHPVLSGQVTPTQKDGAGFLGCPVLRNIAYGNKPAHADQENVTHGENTSPIEKPSIPYNKKESWPKASPHEASAEECVVLDQLVEKLENHIRGFYERVIWKYRKTGIREIDPLLDQDLRKYTQKPDNLYKEVEEFISQFTFHQGLLMLTALVQIETNNAETNPVLTADHSLDTHIEKFCEKNKHNPNMRPIDPELVKTVYKEMQEKFDVQHGIKICAPISDFYHALKPDPSVFIMPGERIYPKFMKSRGVRPTTTRRINIEKDEAALQVAIHASAAMLMDAILDTGVTKAHEEAHDRTFNIFNRQKLLERSDFWFSGYKEVVLEGKELPPSYPEINSQAFDEFKAMGLDVEAEARYIRPALVKIPMPEGVQFEGFVTVAIHAKTNKCLQVAEDHTVSPVRKRYAITQDRVYMGEGDKLDIPIDNLIERGKLLPMMKTSVEVKVFDDPGSAFAEWRTQDKSRTPVRLTFPNSVMPGVKETWSEFGGRLKDDLVGGLVNPFTK
jgi:hypothetical protein